MSKDPFYKDSEDLYGVLPEDFTVISTMLYPDALNQKIKWAKKLANELTLIHYLEIDSYRIKRVTNAIKHNQAALAEL